MSSTDASVGRPPVFDLSGVKATHSKSHSSHRLHVSSGVCNVQAMQRCRVHVVNEVLTDGQAPICLFAIIGEGRSAQAAQHVRSTLVPAVQHALKGSKLSSGADAKGGWRSPLHTAFRGLDASYKKLYFPKADSVHPTSSGSAVLLDSNSNTAYSLWYGNGTQPCWITDATGAVIAPSKRHSEYTHRTTIKEEVRYGLDGQMMFLLGNTGLWTNVHPAKAAANAAVFAEDGEFGFGMSTSASAALSYPHDPAAAAVMSALRHLVQKCSRSEDPRLSCLYNIKQLDRIPPGSREEAKGGAIVPRYRGDVHPDMAALVATVHLSPAPTQPEHSGLAGAARRLLHVQSDTGLCNMSRCSANSQLQRTSDTRPSRPAERGHVRRSSIVTGPSSIAAGPDSPRANQTGSARRALGHLRSALRRSSPYASTDSLQALSVSNTSEPPGSGHIPTSRNMTRTQWHWHLLLTHARAVAAEARVRRRMWQAAARLARKAQQDQLDSAAATGSQ